MNRDYKDNVEWRPVTGYEGDYMVSSNGLVKSLKGIKERILEGSKKPRKGKDIYPTVTLSKNGKLKTIRVHRIVAKEFIDNPNGYDLVLHKDDNPINNNIENLYWGTRDHNIEDMRRNNVMQIGEQCHSSVLTKTQVIEIRRLYKDTKATRKELSEKFGVTYQNIMMIVKNKTWKHI